MQWITRMEELEAHYGAPGAAATRKVAGRLSPEYRRWIEVSRFAVLSTVGPEGTDASPRGDDGPVVRVIDASTLALPDWKGNERIDSLRNLVRDPRLSLMFMVAGSDNVVRVNGEGRLTADAGLCASFARDGKGGGTAPRTVLVIHIHEVYIQCSRAILRAGLWKGGEGAGDLPTVGTILAGLTRGEVGGEDYDRAWPARAAATMW